MNNLFKAGDKVICVNIGHNTSLTVGKIYKVESTFRRETLRVINDLGQTCSYYNSRFELVEDKFFLTNSKINVQKYADDNGLTLAVACKEIQEWLFAQGYKWGFRGTDVFTYTFRYIFTDSFAANELTYCDEEQSFEVNAHKEITLQRTVAVTLTPSFVEPVEDVEYVELGGKRYVKADLEEALSKIKAVEE